MSRPVISSEEDALRELGATPSRPRRLERDLSAPFDRLAWDEFEVFCYLLLRKEHLDEEIVYYGKASDLGRDIVRRRRNGGVELVQCKRYSDKVGAPALRKELAKLFTNLFRGDIPERPDRIWFYVVPDLTSPARELLTQDRWVAIAAKALEDYLGTKPPPALLEFACTWWPAEQIHVEPGITLTERAECYPELLEKFFKTQKVIDGSVAEVEAGVKAAMREVLAQREASPPGNISGKLRRIWSRRRRRLAAAGLIACLAAISWIAWPAVWHRILRTPILVLPFTPPPALPDERPISDEIGQALTRQVREKAGLRPIFADIARPIMSTLGLRTPCLPPYSLWQVRRSTGADFVLSGSFEVFHDKQLSELTACFQSTVEGRQPAIRSYRVVQEDDEIEAAAADLARWVRALSGPPSLSRWWSRDVSDDRVVRSYFEGVRHLQRFELKAAQEKLESAVKRDGNFYPAHRGLSRLWQVLGNDGAALDEAQRALELLRREGAGDPREESLLKAHLLSTRGQWDRAALLLRAAWNREPEAGEIAVRLAEAQNQAGFSEQALLSIQTARDRQGLGRLALTPELDANLDLEEATAYFWLGKSREQLAAARRVLGKLLDLPDDRDQMISRARYFECIALTRLEEQSWPPSCDEAIRRFRSNGDLINEAKFLALYAGWLRKKDPRGAEMLDRRVLGVYRDEKFTRGVIDQETNLAYTLSDLGEEREARHLCKDALRLAREQRSLNLPSVLTTCAYFNVMAKQLRPARDQYVDALTLAEQRGNLALKAVLLGNVAYLDHALGELDSALSSYEESLRLSRELGDLGWDYGETLVRFARLLLDRHQEPAARARLREAWNCYLIQQEQEQPSELATVLASIDEVLPKKDAWMLMTAAELAGPHQRSACQPVEGLEPEPGAGTDI